MKRTKDARISLRVPPEQKELVAIAARLKGVTVSRFVTAAAMDASDRIFTKRCESCGRGKP